MHAEAVAEGVHRLCTLMVNVYFVESSGQWWLVDTGLPGYSASVRREGERRFGTPPAGILLTHGHFDHVGGLPALAEAWGAPVYAHPLELPYLTGRSSYPPPDPTVGGGAQSWLSPLFPRGPIDLDGRIRMLPEGGNVPGLVDWTWLRTAGHAPGHVSFYREGDRTLIAGDAVVTTKQESTISVLLQRERVWRPPAYYTCDWAAARRSVETIAALEPEVLATGHGHALRGAAMREGLRELADRFDTLMPDHGRYIPYPAVTDERGVVHVPPRVGLAPGQVAAAAAIGAAVVAAVWLGARAVSDTTAVGV
ncbi:MAG TPA: MBL fold metallo-hydrolase [Vicinamibacterales bacterium]|nr:MBL fold metallo-hydrolase [Vicinamibacterales bacterium]